MKILVGCEYSGRVRDAFIAKGHDAVSCDILPTDAPGPHYQGDIRDIIYDGWDLMVCHPPCTHLSVSGARHFAEKIADGRQQAALDFVRFLLDLPQVGWPEGGRMPPPFKPHGIPRIALENPVSIISSKIRQPDQVIQPWMFGHGETKATCLWLRGLPRLRPTNIVPGREARIHLLPPSDGRWKLRSETYQGIAKAMADQWSDEELSPYAVMEQLRFAL